MSTTDQNEAYGGHPLHLRHIIPIDFHAVRTLPESHVWPNLNDKLSPDAALASPSIPVIDLSNSNTAVQLIGHACETWGAFQIVNHGISLNLLDQVESEARRLFSLPAEQKMKALREPDCATGYGRARISQFFPKYMWHEGFTIMGSPVDHAAQLWPNDFAPFCEVMENYQKKLQVLAHRLTSLVLKSLNVSQQDTNQVGLPFAALQLNSYPPCPDPTRALGLAPHTDTSLLTVIYQREIKGLEIFREGHGWVPVQPIGGALVVEVGDLLHIVSNGRFTNVLHRVVVNEDRFHRFSVAYFYGPPIDSDVAPMVRLGEVARFRTVSVKEFVGLKAKNLENALSLIRI